MREAGVELMVDSTELGVMGISEVFGLLFTFIRIMRQLVKKAAEERPDAVILIDYPGFNIRLAKRLHKLGIKVIWYISPQVWVWRKSNIPKLARYCTKMMVIFPFEVEVYQGSGLDVEFVGHPLTEIIQQGMDPALKRDPHSVLLLPGSRSREIDYLLQPILETARLLAIKHPDLKFIISAARPGVEAKIRDGLKYFMERHAAEKLPEMEICTGNSRKLMQTCSTGLAVSGTVTVECALSSLPLVVCYKFSHLTFLFAGILVRKLFRNAFAMPNIILNRHIFEEYLQYFVRPKTMAEAVEKILPDGSRRLLVEDGMKEMTQMISGGVTGASENAARCVLKVIHS